MSRLDNKVAIVTGGASGFGMGIVRHFVAAGARVLVADLDEQKARALADELDGSAARVEALRVDVTKADDVATMIETAQSRLGGLDVLVNNAGIGQRPGPLEETTDEVYDTLFDVNVRSVFLCCRSVLPVFRRQGYGNIVNTASGIALTPRPNLVAYGATKGAVVTFTKGLAMELAEEGIRVNALCPAAGDTPMLAEFMGGEETEEGRSRFTASVPMGRLITPDDMGAAAVFLASDEAAMVTGTCLGRRRRALHLMAARARRQRGGARAAKRALRAGGHDRTQGAVYPGGSYKPLSQADLERIHHAALDVLERIGMAGATETMHELATQRGAHVNAHGRLCFPASMVEDMVAGAAHRSCSTAACPSMTSRSPVNACTTVPGAPRSRSWIRRHAATAPRPWSICTTSHVWPTGWRT